MQVNLEEEEEEEEGFSRKSGQVGRNRYSIWSYISLGEEENIGVPCLKLIDLLASFH